MGPKTGLWQPHRDEELRRQKWSYWDLWQATPSMITKQTNPFAANCRQNTEGTGSQTYKECHKTESLWNHTSTAHKEREQLGDWRSNGESSCNSGDGTGQMAQPWMFMMMIAVPFSVVRDLQHLGHSLGMIFTSAQVYTRYIIVLQTSIPQI